MPDLLRIVAIAGSLRAGSANRALTLAAAELAPPGTTVELAEIGALPLYNSDLEAERPAAVVALREALAGADALLLATPEYNHNTSGVLQNAIDWASRPAFRSPLAGLPTGIIGAASGAVGTARAQEVLKAVMLAVLAPVFPHRGVLVGGAASKVTEGRLTDEATRAFLADYLAAFAAWARRLGREHAT